MRLAIIPFLLLAVPLAEIAAFILVGRQIGVVATLALVLVTAVIGSILLRIQGFGLLQRITAETRAGRVPGRELVHGVMILIAGVLLLVPGFVTDALGFLLFVPKLRDMGWRLIRDRVTVVAADIGRGAAGRGRGDPAAGRYGTRYTPAGEPVIDLDDDDFQRDPDPSSPWRGDDPGEGEGRRR
jgi:UPF0716 protein FxsA